MDELEYERTRIGPEWPLLNLLARRRTGRAREGRRIGIGHDLESLEGNEYPVLPLPDTVVFPNLVTPLFLSRDRSARAVEAAEAMEVPLLVVAQRDPQVLDPDLSDLYTIGTVVEVGRVLHMPDGSTTALVQGIERARILELIDTEPYLRVRGVPLYEDERHDMASEALMRAVLALFEKVVDLNPNLPEDAYVAAMNEKEPGSLADLLAHVLDLETPQRQELLETLDANVRLQQLSIILGQELDVLELEDRIQTQVQQEVDKTQREYYLREQMRAIQTELGEEDENQRELGDLRQKLIQAGLPEAVRLKAEKEMSRLAQMPPMSPETTVIRNYLDWLIDLPWTVATEDNLDIKRAAAVLEQNHYGLPKVKERILEHIAVRKLAREKMKSPILCFVGPPGTGKTSLGRSIAEALGRKFVRLSLGGVRDEAEIRGHRRTYIGSLPGRILQTMHTAGSVNPLFMLDEIDKLGMDFRGDPSSALLEVLDPEQNHAFSDHYLEVPYDLSRVMFITTANILDPIPPALRDRLEVIDFPGYVEEEKLAIARQFLIPRQVEAHGLTARQLQFSVEALRTIVREYTYEAGVRNLERNIANICRKTARRIAENKRSIHRITPRQVNRLLGPPQYSEWLANEQDEVGVANGLAWSEAGGDVMQVEVSAMEGKGALTLTGQIGEVMQESAQAALTYARSHAEEFGLQELDFDKLDLHIHVPEGAIPKDGPSAGVTMAAALISALSARPIRHDLAMTGEITLRGRVLPIGGLKEKLMAAHRMHIKTVIFPKRNEKDLADVPRDVQRDLELVPVERMDEIIGRALLEAQPVRSRARPRVQRSRKKAAEPAADVAPPHDGAAAAGE
ncbi:MAG: Lon protease 1 [Chloroflexi bacterium ADurb.Bin325]|nr:MAG: Lon protease 1 [Chloroflexi bacterium ADurb.Bin325]